MSFTSRLVIALVAGVFAAAILSPFVAAILATAGLRFPFPRIFDRVVMATVLGAIFLQARRLRLMPLLRAGYARPGTNFARSTRGFLVAIATVAILIFAAAAMGARSGEPAWHIWRILPKYFLSAIAIAIIEEGFFRAILFGGMTGDFGRTTALALSSAIYALAHLVRSPAHFYVTGVHPWLGFHNLAASAAQLSHPMLAFPTFFGLFMLGLVLAEAYVLTGTVYFSMGLHAGFVVGAKMWPKLTSAGVALPGWLEGWGRIPLISGAAAWAMALGILLLLRPLAGRSLMAAGNLTPGPFPEGKGGQ
jgi:membrane protease YdiL (CAAX protease family)